RTAFDELLLHKQAGCRFAGLPGLEISAAMRIFIIDFQTKLSISAQKGGAGYSPAPPKMPINYALRRLTALGTRASGCTSNAAFCHSFRVRMPAASTAVAWTKTSFAPPSGAIKPNPLVALKNFTVPMAIECSCEPNRVYAQALCLSAARRRK